MKLQLLKKPLIWAGYLAGILILTILLFLLPATVQENISGIFLSNPNSSNTSDHISEGDLNTYRKNLLLDINSDKSKLLNKIPGGYYLIINISENRFKLCDSKGIIREGICSTGSFVKLINKDSLSWTFKTPKGAFKVLKKITNPVWRKPDWAFVEEGLPIPAYNHPSRFEYGVLGDYALSLGDGYLIHGTLYQRQLGQPVTHGCVRLADDDLEMVYKYLKLGSRVLIF